MLPAFPDFKKITLDDRGLIQAYSSVDHPCSDFNFTNLWAWDATHPCEISQLRGNLVVRLTDNLVKYPFLSFVGKEQIASTAMDLLAYAKSQHIDPQLRLINEEIAAHLMSDGHFIVESDHDNFDYIISINEITLIENRYLKTKFRAIRRLLELHPDIEFSISSLDACTKEDILVSFDIWKKNNQMRANHNENQVIQEERALKRMLDLQHTEHNNLLVSTVRHKQEIIGFCIDESLLGGQVLSHFIKGDLHYRGIYEYMNYNVALHLKSKGFDTWNWQQDLGAPGLRQVKLSYRPIYMLNKYRIKS